MVHSVCHAYEQLKLYWSTALKKILLAGSNNWTQTLGLQSNRGPHPYFRGGLIFSHLSVSLCLRQSCNCVSWFCLFLGCSSSWQLWWLDVSMVLNFCTGIRVDCNGRAKFDLGDRGCVFHCASLMYSVSWFQSEKVWNVSWYCLVSTPE